MDPVLISYQGCWPSRPEATHLGKVFGFLRIKKRWQETKEKYFHLGCSGHFVSGALITGVQGLALGGPPLQGVGLERPEPSGGRRRNDDGGNSTWGESQRGVYPWGESKRGVTPQSVSKPVKEQPTQTTPKHPKASLFQWPTTSLKRSLFPKKTVQIKKEPHPTVLTHGEGPLLEKVSFSQENRAKIDQKVLVLLRKS